MYSLRVLVGSALLVLVQTTIIRRSITNSTTSQNTTSTLPASTKAAETLVVKIAETTANGSIGLEGAKLEETRRKNYKERSTSSSSGAKSDESGEDDVNKESLELSDSTDVDTDSQKNKKQKYNKEKKGWRKWHRTCTPCIEEMKMKWRNPSIKWICGGYQRARRSFKSTCMMHYRNCEDGTMFVKLHDHRCADDDRNNSVLLPHGDHFLYDYKVVLSGDDSDKTDVSSDEESDDDDDSESD